MDGGKPEKNPSVAVWLKYFDKELYEAIDDQGILGLLKPRFGSSLTFIYPAEKSYRSKIIEKLNGSDATVGVNMIQSLTIVRENLAEPSDWIRMKENIPNALGQKIKLSDKSTNQQVVLANDAVLTINKEFNSRDENITVWDYKGKTELPLDGEPAEFVKRAPKVSKKNPKKSGGFLLVPSKAAFTKRLEEQSLILLKDDDKNDRFIKSNPFTAAMLSFVHYLIAKGHTEELKLLNTLCEPNSVATYYAVMLPYCANSLLEKAIEQWLKDTNGICIESKPNEQWSKYVSQLDCEDEKMHDELLELKSNLVTGSLKSDCERLYSKYFGDKWQLRLKGDELRFVINCAMSKLLSPISLSQLFLDIQVLYCPSKDSFFLVNNSNKDPVFLATSVSFVLSRCFMSVPCPKVDKFAVITFAELLKSDQTLELVLISDDEKYLKQTESNPELDFVSNLKRMINNLPETMKKDLVAKICS